MDTNYPTHPHPAYTIPWPPDKIKHWNEIERPLKGNQLKECVDKLACKQSRSPCDADTLIRCLTAEPPSAECARRIVEHALTLLLGTDGKPQTTSATLLDGFVRRFLASSPAAHSTSEESRMQRGVGGIKEQIYDAQKTLGAILGVEAKEAEKEFAGEMSDIAATFYAAEHRDNVSEADALDPDTRVRWQELTLDERRRARRVRKRVLNLDNPFARGRPRVLDTGLHDYLRWCIEDFTGKPLRRTPTRPGCLALMTAYRLALPTRPLSDDALLHRLRA